MSCSCTPSEPWNPIRKFQKLEAINGPGEPEDSPATARRDVMQLHARWVLVS